MTLLVERQEGHLVCKKLEWWGAGVVICLERGADLHIAQLMPLPLTVSSFSKIQIGSNFLVLAYPSSPGKGPLNGFVFVPHPIPEHPLRFSADSVCILNFTKFIFSSNFFSVNTKSKSYT